MKKELSKNIKETLSQVSNSEISKIEVREDSLENNINYIFEDLVNFYAEINPNLVTLKNKLIYFNSSSKSNDNAYPVMLDDLYREASSTHSACINLRRDMIIGNGLEPTTPDAATEEFLNKINRIGNNWQDTWYKIATDVEIHGMFSLALYYNIKGLIPEVVHRDISSVRAVSLVDDEYINAVQQWAISNKWGDIATKNRYTSNNSCYFINNYNPNTIKDDGYKQLLVFRKYIPGVFPYGLPHYQSVLKYIKLDNELAKYHLNKVAGGFFPNVIIQLPGDPNDEEKQKFKNQFMRKYRGPDKEKIMFIWKKNEDSPVPTIVPFNTNDDNQVFEILDRILTQKILTAHQTQPELASIPTQGAQLGGDSNKILVSRQYMIETVIKPIQKLMLQEINKIFKHNGLQPVTVKNEVLKLTPEDNNNAGGNPAVTN